MKLVLDRSKSVNISKDMYGLFFEDINYSLDGGLNAEMLENRNFEALFVSGNNDHYYPVFDGSYGWSVFEDDGNGSAIYMDSIEPVNGTNPHYLVFEGKGCMPSLKNKAYDGLYVKKDMGYNVSFYAKPVNGNKEVSVAVAKYGRCIAAAKVTLDCEDWKKYELELVAAEDADQCDFIVSLGGEGTVKFDHFSMMPKDAVLGIFRKDLVEKLEGLEPSFIRFPGGCVVEGNTLENRYKWKDTIAKPEERKYNWNRWAVHNNNFRTGLSGTYPHYGQTLAVGYYEYFLLCEYLKASPLPVMNVGLACQFMSHEKAGLGSEQFKQFVQDALDLIEFANGAVDTTWGAKRAAMGHPEPFNLVYLGVGNEQWETEEVQFYKRYQFFEEAIHEKYPEIKIIGTSGPDVWGGGYFRAWNWAKDKYKTNKNFMYAMDEHYYVAPEWLYEHVHFYDNYDRDIKVFAGEYACHIKGLAGRMNCPEANNLKAAIAEAAFLTGIEKNADVVVLASYAPLFARMGYTQWSPNLIWFDGKESVATPSYYVQQLYSRYRGVKTLNADFGLQAEEELKEKLYASAVELADGSIVIKLVNGSDEDKTFAVDNSIAGKNAKYELLTGDEDAYNNMREPEKVAVKTGNMVVEKNMTLPKNSFMVLVME